MLRGITEEESAGAGALASFLVTTANKYVVRFGWRSRFVSVSEALIDTE
jgi:hypothetical protein